MHPTIATLLGQHKRRWANIEITLGECPVFAGLPKNVLSLAHYIGRCPNITALLGRCLMEVPAYLDLTPTVHHLPVVPLPFPLPSYVTAPPASCLH